MQSHVYAELVRLERAALARGPRTRSGGMHGLRGGGGLGELTMDQMHIVLGTGSFIAGAVVMHLLHRYKVMR